MVFRVKVSFVAAWVLDRYVARGCKLVSDATDVYLEVKDEQEAELLERLNAQRKKVLALEGELLKLWFWS